MWYFNNTLSLNTIKNKYGTSNMIDFYKKTLKNNKNLAIRLINDNTIAFSTLYPLIQTSIENKLYYDFTPKNILMLKIYFKATHNSFLEDETDQLMQINETLYYNTLKWMVQNCENNIEVDATYSKLIDVSLSLLLLKYKDKSSIDSVVKLIFKRCKNETCYHDLVWALFELKDYQILETIAFYLKSSNLIEKNLAIKLLNFKDEKVIYSYTNCMNFMRENKDYIYFTGDGLNLSSNPMFFEIHLNAKYLCKPSITNTSDPSNLLTPKENDHLNKFNQLTPEAQITLANYSNSIYKQNKRLWRAWSNFDTDNQMEAYKKGMGGRYD
jgi:hypothetical protein